MTASKPIKIDQVTKIFSTDLLKKPMIAVNQLSIEIEDREIFGFLGPNGSGKTTTIKMLLDIVRPSRGSITIFGRDARDPTSRAVVGVMPEQATFYDYLTASELLTYYARLRGVDRDIRATRIQELIERVGLQGHQQRRLRYYSKGMLQRVAIAQALLAKPKLLILDEPMTGLDPVGRKEMRDMIAEARDQGATVLMSTHILSDVELLCDRIGIIIGGVLRKSGKLETLLKDHGETTDIHAGQIPEVVQRSLESQGAVVRTVGTATLVRAPYSLQQLVITALARAEVSIEVVMPRSKGLEELFLAEVKASEVFTPAVES